MFCFLELLEELCFPPFRIRPNLTYYFSLKIIDMLRNLDHPMSMHLEQELVLLVLGLKSDLHQSLLRLVFPVEL